MSNLEQYTLVECLCSFTMSVFKVMWKYSCLQICDCSVNHAWWPVTGILVLEILVPRTKIFAGKYGPPLENRSGLKTLILGLLSQTREYKTTANQQRTSLVTLNAPGEVSNKTELLFWQAESATDRSN